MCKFLVKVNYSSGSWAPMIKSPADRAVAVSGLMECLGGSLECLYWDVESCAGIAVADLPDSVTAAAVLTAAAKTGAFNGVEAHELMSQDQLTDVLLLARSTSGVYKPPGYSAADRGL